MSLFSSQSGGNFSEMERFFFKEKKYHGPRQNYKVMKIKGDDGEDTKNSIIAAI